MTFTKAIESLTAEQRAEFTALAQRRDVPSVMLLQKLREFTGILYSDTTVQSWRKRELGWTPDRRAILSKVRTSKHTRTLAGPHAAGYYRRNGIC